MIDTFAECLRQRLGIRMAFIGQRGNPARKLIAARIEKNFGFRAFREATFGQLRSTAVDLFAEGFRQRLDLACTALLSASVHLALQARRYASD